MAEQQRVEIAGSHRTLPRGATAGSAVSGTHQLDVSIYLRRGDESGVVTLADAPARRRERLAAHRAHAHAAAIAAIGRFATDHGLAVVATDPASRLVRVRGTAAALARAFGCALHHVDGPGGARFIAHDRPLSVPRELGPVIESVLGLDNRPVATPKFLRASGGTATPHLPNAVGALYDYPTGTTGQGQTVALIELGGGFNDADNAEAFAAMGLAVPTIVAVGVDGGANTPGSDADGEVALDIQVVGGNAPGAKIVVYFTPNTDQGFADAISTAAHDTANGVTVMSISWGGPESGWSSQAVTTMNTQLEDAGTLGISVFVASGDSLATDGVDDGHAHVDFPASSPYAIGCGGTNIRTDNGAITAETVWNDGTSGTGGGISDLFDVPSFQANVTLPPSVNNNRRGRGVPDVAGDAAPATGYTVVLDGESEAVGGTSAVAPLWAALAALVNASRGAALGFFLPALYASAAASTDGAVREITTGTNKPTGSQIGYDAGPHWNGCTGLGRPDGAALLRALGTATPSA